MRKYTRNSFIFEKPEAVMLFVMIGISQPANIEKYWKNTDSQAEYKHQLFVLVIS